MTDNWRNAVNEVFSNKELMRQFWRNVYAARELERGVMEGGKATDRQLAAHAYLKAGIPLSDFPKHYAVDTLGAHGILTKAARAAYKAIAASYRPV